MHISLKDSFGRTCAFSFYMYDIPSQCGMRMFTALNWNSSAEGCGMFIKELITCMSGGVLSQGVGIDNAPSFYSTIKTGALVMTDRFYPKIIPGPYLLHEITKKEFKNYWNSPTHFVCNPNYNNEHKLCLFSLSATKLKKQKVELYAPVIDEITDDLDGFITSYEHGTL